MLGLLEATGDLARLGTPEEYRRYARIIGRVGRVVLGWYGNNDAVARSDDVRATAPLVELLVRSLNTLMFRQEHSPAHKLELDLRDGGLPHLLAFMGLEADRADSARYLSEGQTVPMLTEQLLNEMFANRRDPTEIRWAIAERVYRERIRDTALFLSFTMGDVSAGKLLPNGRREHTVTWGCYDPVTNLPHLHMLVFEWSGEKPLLEDTTRLSLLRESIRTEGGRVPPLGVLANEIDRDLPQLHPKRLVRVRLGPLRVPGFCRGSSLLTEVVSSHGDEDDFALEVRVEGLESKREEFVPERGALAKLIGAGRVVQVYHLPNDTPECAEAVASYVMHRLVLPHHVLQAMRHNDPALAGYRSDHIATYDRSESVVAN
jgi:hypothetical protein